MSRPVIYQWIAANSNAIALSQNLAAPGSLILNGSMSFNGIAAFQNISRTVKISSVNDLHLVNFTVTGTLNGAAVSQTIVGPNVGNVSTTQIFQTVTSVTADGAANAVLVGTGQTGQTNYFQYDYNRNVSVLGMNIGVTGVITYEVHATGGDPTSASFVDATVTPASAVNQNLVFTGAVNYYWIKITATTGAATLTAEITQQGLTN